MLNTKGASLKLGCSLTLIRKLVRNNRLTAYAYGDDGNLAPIDPSISQRGKDIYFLEADLETYQPRAKGRPEGAQDKIKDNPNRKKPRKPRKQ